MSIFPHLSRRSRNCDIHVVKLTTFICKYYFSLQQQIKLILSSGENVNETLLYNTASTGCQQ